MILYHYVPNVYSTLLPKVQLRSDLMKKKHIVIFIPKIYKICTKQYLISDKLRYKIFLKSNQTNILFHY